MLNQSDYSLQKWIEKGGGSACLVFTDNVASTSRLSKVGTELTVMRIKIRDLVTEEQWNELFDKTKETDK